MPPTRLVSRMLLEKDEELRKLSEIRRADILFNHRTMRGQVQKRGSDAASFASALPRRLAMLRCCDGREQTRGSQPLSFLSTPQMENAARSRSTHSYGQRRSRQTMVGWLSRWP